MKSYKHLIDRLVQVIQDLMSLVGMLRCHSSALAKGDITCDLFFKLNQKERVVFAAACQSRGLKVEEIKLG